MNSLLKFLRLDSSDRQHLIKTFIVLGLVRLGLWLLPFNVLQIWLGRLSQNPQLSPAMVPPRISYRTVNKIVWAVNVSSRVMPGQVKCLARALTTQVLMCRRGYAPELRIGVAKDKTDTLEAHAWVELQGHIVMGYLEDLSRFTPMPSL